MESHVGMCLLAIFKPSFAKSLIKYCGLFFMPQFAADVKNFVEKGLALKVRSYQSLIKYLDRRDLHLCRWA